VILKCNCQYPPQDALHGPGMRVHTPTAKSKAGSGFTTYRCTVCGTLREVKDEKK
jgi:hypothetical protein